ATIIVTYNSARHIERCLLGLREASHSAILHTVVVDNASTDETLQIIRRVAGDVEVVTNGVNVGYAEGNNQAIEMLARYGFNYYLILNPDVVVPPGLLHKLLRVMEIDEQIGIVSPNVFQGRLDKGHSEIEGMWSLWGVPVRRRPHGAHIW